MAQAQYRLWNTTRLKYIVFLYSRYGSALGGGEGGEVARFPHVFWPGFESLLRERGLLLALLALARGT